MKNNIIAIAYFDDKKIKGTIHFYENQSINSGENIINKIIIDINLQGFKKNSIHGIHIHEAGDLTDKCLGACAHFNPTNKNHGGIHSKIRHVGDLGNISADNDGNIITKIEDNIIKLRGNKFNIIGRSVVIHEDADDNGLGGHNDSLTTGHSGKRLCCAVIGYSKKMFQ